MLPESKMLLVDREPLWSYASWIYNYMCNRCLSPLKLWVQILIRRGVLNTTLCNKVCQWLVTSHSLSGHGFLWVLPPPIKLTATYSWNIVESGVKHHNSNLHVLVDSIAMEKGTRWNHHHFWHERPLIIFCYSNIKWNVQWC